jgi:sec-independent protein translocase protein TatB
MFGFSFAEILLVALVAFIFIKPEDLTEIMRTLGKFAGKIKAYSNEITDLFDDKKTESKITKVLGDDGKFHVAFDVSELENLSGNTQNKSAEIKTPENTSQNEIQK